MVRKNMNIFRKIWLLVRKYCLGIDDRSAMEIAIDNGMIVGENANFQDEIIFDPSHSWLISIGDNVTIAPRVHILCHDASTKSALGYTKIGKVKIGNNTFVGANTTILPNVVIGNFCIIGANSVVTHDIPNNSVAVGNPCKVIKTYEEYIEQNSNMMKKRKIYFGEDYIINNISEVKKKEMKEKLETGIGFIR